MLSLSVYTTENVCCDQAETAGDRMDLLSLRVGGATSMAISPEQVDRTSGQEEHFAKALYVIVSGKQRKGCETNDTE